MKKVFTSKLFYLISLVLINICLLVTLFLVINKRFAYPTEYVIKEPISQGNVETVLSKYYTVKMGDIQVKENRDAYISVFDDLCSEITLDEVEINKLSEITKGQKIGKSGGNDIFSSSDSFCLDVKEVLGSYTVTLYNYDKFIVKVSVSEKEYMQKKLDTVLAINLYLNEVPCEFQFVEYDLSSFKENGSIYAVFQPKNCKMLVSNYTAVRCDFVLEVIQEVFYTSAAAFDYEIKGNRFYVMNESKSESITLYSNRIVDGYAIIDESSSVELNEGLKLYVE